nr:protein-L-isoaspartate(D-aspartate) O-methyltransferase [Ochrobactrum sp. CM-21-5]
MADIVDFTRARRRMVKTQIERRGIRDTKVLQAMREVPREMFVEAGYEEFAYEDSPLPIGEGQTISQPFIVALMVEAANVQSTDCVLEVGAGSGYATAVLSRIAAKVIAIERHSELVVLAKERLRKLSYDNVALHFGDGTKGWLESAPYDVIVVSAAGTRIPEALKDQLAVGGRLIVPVGRSWGNQVLLKITRCGATEYFSEDIDKVRFVPLIEG